MWSEYILQLNNNKYYAGHSSTIKKRLIRNHKGYVPYNKPFRPLKLKTQVAFSDRNQTYAFEKYLKSGAERAFAKKRLIPKNITSPEN